MGVDASDAAARAQARAAWLGTQVLPHEPALRRWLARRVGQPHDVEDVVQECYAILAGLDQVGHVRDPRAYLFSVAQSLLLQQLRRAQVVSIEAIGDIDRLPPADVPSVEARAAARQELDRVAELVAALPDKCREAFVLRRVEGYSQREIALRMRISENTVEKHICKGLRLLLEAIAQVPDAATDATVSKGKRHAGRR